ncbi:hypothetical protein [Tautonia plasticadhaerens]|uniref:Uncharacterized protein n=1 Tax=Tautonia plasticadhaerens TaxID=2527974 RepID=A0A518H8G1_9BACT|nr:hypothetical protein [Tautonia plasticadhaerens]QDV37115.1 hypothetical protein ElP_50480 [Tautonia plasticadhaerens]
MRHTVRLVAVLGVCLGGPVGPSHGFAQDSGPAPIPEFTLDQTLPTVQIPRRSPRVNETVIDATPLPRDKAPQVDYREQQANFKIGDQVTGQNSGATGTILADDDQGLEGTLTLGQVQGVFEEGESIAGQQSGSATADSALREGVWVLDFAFKPLRTRTIDIPNLGRRTVLYLYYRVVNRSGKPRMFVPQFFLETDDGQRSPDVVLPQAVEVVRVREHTSPTAAGAASVVGAPLLGAVRVTGMIPPSEEDEVDEAVLGVAFWVLDEEIARSDSLKVFVRGLSDGLQITQGEDGAQDVRYKTLRIDFDTPGDEFDRREREIRLKTPAYEWVYD